jgi:hypothetical protein
LNPSPRPARWRPVLFGLALALCGAVSAWLLYDRERAYDPDFDAVVADPAYRGGGPIVLYDEGHRNTHTASAGYRPLAELLRNDGYALRTWSQALTVAALEGVGVLLVVLPRGATDANDDSAFSAVEIDLLELWVRRGGSLLLVTDHWPYGAAAASLAERFEVRMGKGLVEDSTQHDPERGASHLVFSGENGLLRDHPIVRGRRDTERIRRVISFTGQSLLGPPAAVPFLALSETAVERPPGAPRVERDGGDVRVSMEYGEPVPAAGRAQGLAVEWGEGRLVVLGEAGMLRAQRSGNVDRVGMNVPGYDNRQLALNILHWLSRRI